MKIKINIEAHISSETIRYTIICMIIFLALFFLKYYEFSTISDCLAIVSGIHDLLEIFSIYK